MGIDHICHQIAKQIDLYFVQPRFKYLFLILYSNSYCESTFRTTEILGKDTTKGVYTETLSIRNYILGILIPKVNIFGQLVCYEWETRKCKQQQAAANNDPEDRTSTITFVNILTQNKYCVIIVFIIYF